MKLSQFANRKWNYTALSFAFPFFGILCIMIIGQYSPFGQYSMLYSDMYQQREIAKQPRFWDQYAQ